LVNRTPIMLGSMELIIPYRKLETCNLYGILQGCSKFRDSDSCTRILRQAQYRFRGMHGTFPSFYGTLRRPCCPCIPCTKRGFCQVGDPACAWRGACATAIRNSFRGFGHFESFFQSYLSRISYTLGVRIPGGHSHIKLQLIKR
jgi:hypothetical protein